jgi:hypothetical protein
MDITNPHVGIEIATHTFLTLAFEGALPTDKKHQYNLNIRPEIEVKLHSFLTLALGG